MATATRLFMVFAGLALIGLAPVLSASRALPTSTLILGIIIGAASFFRGITE